MQNIQQIDQAESFCTEKGKRGVVLFIIWEN
jgi:hypothetical protein